MKWVNSSYCIPLEYYLTFVNILTLWLVAVDNGLAFWPQLEAPLCVTLLSCPPIFCHGLWLTNNTNPCNAVNQTYDNFCRFSKDTWLHLKRITEEAQETETVGAHVYRLLTREPWFDNRYEGYFGNVQLAGVLDARVMYVLNYIGECQQQYGDSIFI